MDEKKERERVSAPFCVVAKTTTKVVFERTKTRPPAFVARAVSKRSSNDDDDDDDSQSVNLDDDDDDEIDREALVGSHRRGGLVFVPSSFRFQSPGATVSGYVLQLRKLVLSNLKAEYIVLVLYSGMPKRNACDAKCR